MAEPVMVWRDVIRDIYRATIDGVVYEVPDDIPLDRQHCASRNHVMMYGTEITEDDNG